MRAALVTICAVLTTLLACTPIEPTRPGLSVLDGQVDVSPEATFVVDPIPLDSEVLTLPGVIELHDANNELVAGVVTIEEGRLRYDPNEPLGPGTYTLSAFDSEAIGSASLGHGIVPNTRLAEHQATFSVGPANGRALYLVQDSLEEAACYIVFNTYLDPTTVDGQFERDGTFLDVNVLEDSRAVTLPCPTVGSPPTFVRGGLRTRNGEPVENSSFAVAIPVEIDFILGAPEVGRW